MVIRMMYLKDESGPEKARRRRATALQYEQGVDNAPRVIATGSGQIAEKIIKIAQENDIPIREDPILAAALSKININEEIPPELYAVVAEVLAYVYRVKNIRNQGH